MIKACIFDMDGTVVNTINSIAYFANNALNKYGLPSIETEKYKILVGDGAAVLVERMIKEVGGTAEQEKAVLEEYSTTYDNDFLYLTDAYDGILDMLKQLKENNIITAVLSNKPDVTAKKVSDALFGDLMDICYGGREGIPLKPNPQAAIALLDEMGVKPEECLYVGDTATDMKTGKGANLYTIGVLWGFRDEKELSDGGADCIISSPKDIVRLAKER